MLYFGGIKNVCIFDKRKHKTKHGTNRNNRENRF
jgi:hypothetical protein